MQLRPHGAKLHLAHCPRGARFGAAVHLPRRYGRGGSSGGIEAQRADQPCHLARPGCGARQSSVEQASRHGARRRVQAGAQLSGPTKLLCLPQPGLIEQHFPLLNLPSTDEFFRKIVLSSAEQSALDSSLIDSIELYHLANAPDKVIETVNRALGASLSIPNANSAVSSGNDLGISGAFGGVSDLYSLAGRVRDVYERDVVKRSKIPAGAWETLGVLVKLKLGLSQFAQGRADLALEVRVPGWTVSGFVADSRPSKQRASSRSTRTQRPLRRRRRRSRRCWTSRRLAPSTRLSSRR